MKITQYICRQKKKCTILLELQRGGLLALALEQETVATARVFKGGGPWFKNYI